MNSREFLSLLQKMEQLSQEDVNTALKLQEEFPYFLIPKILGARYEWDQSAGSARSQLHWAAILSPNRKRLKGLLTGSILPTHPLATDDLVSSEPEEKKR